MTPDLKSTIKTFKDTQDINYSVAWIDCLATGKSSGRSIIRLGEHAKKDELPIELSYQPLSFESKTKINIFFNFPSTLMNPFLVKIFNVMYYWKNAFASKSKLISWDNYSQCVHFGEGRPEL